MLTRSGVLLLLAAAATAAAGRVLGSVELAVLAGAAVAAVALGALQVLVSRPTLTVSRTVRPDVVALGGAAQVELDLVGRGPRRSPVLTLVEPLGEQRTARLRVAPLAPGERARTTYALPARTRGELAVGPLRAEATDALGLARRRVEVAPATRVLVLPRTVAVDLRGLTGRHGAGAGRRAGPSRRRGDDELRSLRPYERGDDLRRVHWPTSARVDELVVRDEDQDQPGAATVVLDTAPGADEAAFEAAVSAAASLAVALADRGDRVRVATTSGSDTGWAEDRRGLAAVLGALALVAPQAAPAAAATAALSAADLLVTADPGLAARGRTGGVVVVALGPAAAGADDGSWAVPPGVPLEQALAAPPRSLVAGRRR